MDAHVRLTDDVPALDRILDRRRLPFGAPHRARLHEHGQGGRVVGDGEAREQRPVPADPRRHEVHDRRLQFERGSESAVVAVLRIGAAIRVEDPVGRLHVPVRRIHRRLDRKRGGPALGGRAEDALLAVQKRNALTAERKSTVEAADVRHVLAELCAEDGERGETRASDVIVAHAADSLRTGGKREAPRVNGALRSPIVS